MPDREKVTSALEKALAISEAVDSGFIWITVGEAKKALELLKEQEPRVLTHDEAIALPEGTPVWFEECTDAGQTFLGPMICHGNGLYGNRFMQVDAKQLYWRGRRFWNARPTDEQRKAVKWDG